MKTCSRCGETKELTKFYRRADSADGRRNDCKACNDARRGQRYSENYEAEQERRANYHVEHREEGLARMSAYYDENREDIRKKQQKYAAEHRDEANARNRKWYANNLQELRARARQYYEDNREAFATYNREWQKNNPESVRIGAQRYRARKLEAPGNGVTVQDMDEILDRDGHRCLACGATEDLTLDHVIPLAVGGPHDKNNLQTLCRSCNCSKQTDTVDYRK